jgi:hypothetical protein
MTIAFTGYGKRFTNNRFFRKVWLFWWIDL